MIGKLELKVNLLSMWTNPVNITIDDLSVIIGPNMKVVSHNEVTTFLTVRVTLMTTCTMPTMKPICSISLNTTLKLRGKQVNI